MITCLLSNHIKHSHTLISSTRSQLHSPAFFTLFRVSPWQSIHWRHMAQWSIEPDCKIGSCTLVDGKTPQFDESIFHSNCKKPTITLTINTDPWQGSDTAAELWQSHHLFNWWVLLYGPDLHCLVPGTSCKLVTKRVPGTRPYNSLVCLLSC